MATAAQIAANRANAQASTGPRTEAGKAASSQNALKHGLCAEKLLIDEEERAAWEELRADYLERLRPQGPAEARLADRIAQLAWRRERGATAEAAAWRGYARGGQPGAAKGIARRRWDAEADPAVAAREEPIMNGVTAELLRITMYEGRLTRELARLKAELAELQEARTRRANAERNWAAQQAERAERERQVAEVMARRRAAGEVDPAPPSAEASRIELEAWLRRERARLDAEANRFRAAQQSPANPAA